MQNEANTIEKYIQEIKTMQQNSNLLTFNEINQTINRLKKMKDDITRIVQRLFTFLNEIKTTDSEMIYTIGKRNETVFNKQLKGFLQKIEMKILSLINIENQEIMNIVKEIPTTAVTSLENSKMTAQTIFNSIQQNINDTKLLLSKLSKEYSLKKIEEAQNKLIQAKNSVQTAIEKRKQEEKETNEKKDAMKQSNKTNIKNKETKLIEAKRNRDRASNEYWSVNSLYSERQKEINGLQMYLNYFIDSVNKATGEIDKQKYTFNYGRNCRHCPYCHYYAPPSTHYKPHFPDSDFFELYDAIV